MIFIKPGRLQKKILIGKLMKSLQIASLALTEKGRLSGASLSEQMFEHISII